MSDYIKREDAERLLRYYFLSALTEDERVDELNRIPSADVVEVVRCKDCKYWNDAALCKKHSNPIVGAIYGTGADDYCSEGKRKDHE